MKKAEFKKMIKEYFTNVYRNATGKFIDINIWTNTYEGVTDYMYQVIMLNGHTVSKYHGWLNEDGTIEIRYDGCL